MSFLRFLRTELAPHPGQARAVARTVVAALFATLVVQALHAPHGYWAVFTVYIVSQADAGSSVAKAVQRIAGTLAGGLLAIFAIIAFADQPWFLVPLIFVVAAGGLYLSRVATAPYAPFLGALTFLMFIPEGRGVTATLDAPLWRMAMIVLGAGIGTLAQLLLWPDDPAQLLRNDVASRLRIAAKALDGALRGSTAPSSPALLEASGLGRQLQLLESAERLHPALVHHHAEQARLIGAAERVLVASLAVEREAASPPDAALRARIEAMAKTCRALADALETRATALTIPAATTTLPAAEAHGAVAASIEQLARALGVVQGTLAVVNAPPGRDEPAARIRLSAWLPLSRVAPDAYVPRFAARGGIATTLGYLVMHGVAWPGLSTCMFTPLICAEGSFGAGRQKAMLRIGGAIVGALLGIGTTVLLVPLVTSIAGYLLILLPSFAIAAWVTMGSPRIAYAGIQIALAFAMYGEALGPSTELVAGRDRMMGIALGIALITLLERVLWPHYAGSAFATQIASVLRSQSQMARNGARPIDAAAFDQPERWNALAAYRSLTAALAAIEESRFEVEGPASDADREAALALTARAQQMMLQLVTLVRARPAIERAPDGPEAVSFRALADAHAAVLSGLADYLEGKAPAPPSLATMDAALVAAAGHEPEDRLALHRELADSIRALARSPEIAQLAATAAGSPQPSPEPALL